MGMKPKRKEGSAPSLRSDALLRIADAFIRAREDDITIQLGKRDIDQDS